MAATIPAAGALTIVLLIFGGCCSNVFALEGVIRFASQWERLQARNNADDDSGPSLAVVYCSHSFNSCSRRSPLFQRNSRVRSHI